MSDYRPGRLKPPSEPMTTGPYQDKMVLAIGGLFFGAVAYFILLSLGKSKDDPSLAAWGLVVVGVSSLYFWFVLLTTLGAAVDYLKRIADHVSGRKQ
jgi:hypothetical protein